MRNCGWPAAAYMGVPPARDRAYIRAHEEDAMKEDHFPSRTPKPSGARS